MDFPTWIGSTGVTLLLVAFVLNLLKVMSPDGRLYSVLNLVGAGLACWSSWLIQFMPFVVLEGVWALAALAALTKSVWQGGRRRREQV